MKVDEIKKIYDKTARDYEENVIPAKMCQYMILIHELEMRGNEKVLELGSGPGYLSLKIASMLKDGEVVGVDISHKMVEIASRRAKEAGVENVQFLIGDAVNLPFADGTFDVCVNSYLIHWVSNPRHFLRNIHKVLKKSGKLGIISPSPEWYYEIQQIYHEVLKKYDPHTPTHTRQLVGINAYTGETIHDLLTRAGFNVQKLVSFRFQEATRLDLCLKRIDAKSGGIYFANLPRSIRRKARDEFVRRLLNMSKDLVTTESGYIIIAKKR